MLRTITALLAVLFAVSPFAAQQADANEIGMIYCIFVLDGTFEQPNGTMTPGLAKLVADALARNAEIQAAAPDEKPPLGDGIPWTSFPDLPDHCSANEMALTESEARLRIDYRFDAAADADFADTIVLKALPKGWFIDDVIYQDGSTLRALLDGVLAQQADETTE